MTETTTPEDLAGQSASYSGKGYVQIPRSFSNWLRRGGASMDITTTASNGLLMYHGARAGIPMGQSEYIALAVQDGYVEMRFVMPICSKY